MKIHSEYFDAVRILHMKFSTFHETGKRPGMMECDNVIISGLFPVS